MIKTATWFESDNIVYVFALVASVLLSVWMGYQETVINPDGICYLLSAQIVGSASMHDVMHLCPQAQWPFYSTLIYSVAQISHLSYTAAAYLLNALFSLLSVLAFILIVRELDPADKPRDDALKSADNARLLWLAALVILCNNEFISMREYIIRDHGFWALYLSSMYLLICFFRAPSVTTALAWSACLLFATLFRVEGIFFLVALPFSAFFYPAFTWRQRLTACATLNILNILLASLILLWAIITPYGQSLNLGRLTVISHQIQTAFVITWQHYQTMTAALAHYVLPPESERDAGVVMLWAWLGWYLYNIVCTLSWIYMALVVYAWWQKAVKFTAHAQVVVFGYLAINVIITFGFLAENLFLSKRYMIALCLVLMLWIPFGLNRLIERSANLRNRISLVLTALLIFAGLLAGVVDFGASKTYVHEAGDWLAENVPANSSLYANDFQLMYYSQHFGSGIFAKLPLYIKVAAIAHGQWKQYDYLALRMSFVPEQDTARVVQELKLQPIREFKNKDGDRIAIYKTHAEETVS